jgi:uncharacterized protein (TIGR02147 family)
MNRPSVFEYSDYRAFLKEMFQYRKETTPGYSHRYFARMAGFAAPNFLKLVIDGKRNLTSASISQVAKGFKLKKQEREFFENLVYMNQAEDLAEKNHYYRKMIAMTPKSGIKKIDQAQYDYFSRWYLPVIRELVVFGDRSQTAEQIAGRLDPPVRVKDVENAMDRLMQLGLIRKDDRGRWEQNEALLRTEPEVKSVLIANFHREMIRLADTAIERFPAAKRDITALTLSIDKDRLPELKEKIAAFRQEILENFAADPNPDQVIQINFQVFPVTRTNSKGDRT